MISEADYIRKWNELVAHAYLTHKVKVGPQFYIFWRRSLTSGSNPLSDRVPWITFEACEFIEPLLTPEAIVFEYGSGGSTLFYAKRVNQVISVEHNADWFNNVRDVLAEERIHHCDFRLIPPQPTTASDGCPDDPTSYTSGSPDYQGYNFFDYVTSIDAFADQFFDLVSVDGRARPSCIRHAHRKVKVGGYLLLDNSERPYYQRAQALLEGWEKHDFYGPIPYLSFFTQTTVWRKVKP